MSYTILNQRLYGISPLTDIRKLAPFFYGGIPLGALSSIFESIPEDCHKDSFLMAPPVVPIATPTPLAKPPAKTKSRWLPPDSLFWNLFIAVHGESEFLRIGSKYANREWEEKNLIRQELSKNPKQVQTTNHKITLKNVQEMMSEYMTGVTTLLGVIGFSVYYKIPVYLVDLVKKTHLPFLPTNTDKEPCFLILREGRYELSLEPIPLDESFGLESYTRPLRAISSYKRAELEEIRCRFLGIEGHKIEVNDSSKEALYRALSEHLVWK